MELHREELAVEALEENVDLQRLFSELVEGMVMELHAPKVASMRFMPADAMELQAKVRTLGFEGLKNGKWAEVLDMSPSNGSTLLDQLESFISIYGRYCSIRSRHELKIAIASFGILDPEAPIDAFIRSAVNQMLDKRGIGRVEMNRVKDRTDVHLLRENREIVELVREKMHAALSAD